MSVRKGGSGRGEGIASGRDGWIRAFHRGGNYHICGLSGIRCMFAGQHYSVVSWILCEKDAIVNLLMALRERARLH